MDNMQVLVSAYSCEPGRGSEPGVGWTFVESMSKRVKLLVITRGDKRHVLDRYQSERLKFIYVDVPLFKKKRKYGFSAYLHYYLWQIAALIYVRSHVNLKDITLCHHVTFVNSWTPSFLCMLDKPYIWGPVGQHPSIPSDYILHAGGVFLLCREVSRKYLKKCGLLLDPFSALTRRRATIKLGIDANSCREIGAEPSNLLPAISLSEKEMTYLSKLRGSTAQESSTFKVYWCGNVIHWKGIYLALDAFSKFSEGKHDVSMEFIGTGRDLSRLEQKADTNPSISFIGAMAQDDLFRHLSTHDVFLYPSFEGGGMVVLEAMAMGKPVVCLDYGGAGAMVDRESGVKVSYNGYQNSVNGLADALEVYYSNRDLLEIHGNNAKSRVCRSFCVSAKTDRVFDIYKSLK